MFYTSLNHKYYNIEVKQNQRISLNEKFKNMCINYVKYYVKYVYV